ncbi:MAG: glycosyltransferase family 4 protein [Bacteroidota bacterium]
MTSEKTKPSKGTMVIFCPTKSWGGIEKNVQLRAKYFGGKGYKVYVVLLKNRFRERFDGLKNVEVKSVNKRGGDINVLVILNYYKFLKRVRPYMVFAALKRDWWLVTVSASLAGVPNKILYLGNKRKIRIGIKYKLVFKHFKAKVLVNSNSLREHLLNSTQFFNERNLFRIYNGICLPKPKGEKRHYKKIFNLKENTYLVGCAGWLNLRKGFDLLPEIIRKLPKNIHIIHVGKDGFELDIDKLLEENMDVAPRIHFMGYEPRMDAFFRGIDLFLLCSRSEGMANVLNEALAHGKPIVSTRVPGSEELLDDGTYGILTNIEDTGAMARGITNVYEKRVQFTKENQQKRITDDFSLEKMMAKTEALFFQ